MSGTFEDFYVAEFSTVGKACLAFCGDRELALDATQEAFVRAFVRWRGLQNAPWVGGWVMTTALNLCRRQLKKGALEVLSDRRDAADAFETDPADRVSLLYAIRELPLRQRTAILLFYLGDVPIAAAAQLMQISEGAVKSHLHQARRSLHDALETENNDPQIAHRC